MISRLRGSSEEISVRYWAYFNPEVADSFSILFRFEDITRFHTSRFKVASCHKGSIKTSIEKPFRDLDKMQNVTTLNDRGNFRFVVDLEWDKYTGYFDRDLEYEEVLMDHNYYLESVFKGAKAAIGEPVVEARPFFDYSQGVRTMIINEEGMFVDKADYEAENADDLDEKEKESLALMQSVEGFGREVKNLDEQTERLARTARNSSRGKEESLEGSDLAVQKLNLEYFLDERSKNLQKFNNRFGSGGSWIFVGSLIFFFVFELATIVAYWTAKDYYILETKIDALSLRDVSKYEMFLAKIADSVILIALANRGLNVPHRNASPAEKVESLAQELRYTIGEIDKLNRNQADTIYALKDSNLIDRWVDLKTVQMVDNGKSVTEKLPLNNALRAIIGQALQFKDRTPSSITLKDTDSVYLVRNGLGGIISNLESMKEAMSASFADKDSRLRQSFVLLAAGQLVVGVLIAVLVLLAMLWIFYKRSSILKAYYMFNAEDLNFIQTETYKYLSVIKTRDPTSLMSLNFVFKEIFEITDDKQGQKTAEQTQKRRFWNKRSTVNAKISLVDLLFSLALIGFAVISGGLMLGRSTSEGSIISSVLDNSDSIYGYAQTKYLATSTFVVNFALELEVDFPLAAKILSDPRISLRNYKISQIVDRVNQEYLRVLL